jgi:hypothetical protein
LEPRPSGQHQVEDDGVVVDGPGLIAGIGAVVEDVHGIAFLAEAGLDETRDLAVILDHEDAHEPPLSLV